MLIDQLASIGWQSFVGRKTQFVSIALMSQKGEEEKKDEEKKEGKGETAN